MLPAATALPRSQACARRPEDESIFHIIEIPEEFRRETTYGVIIRKDKHLSSPLRGLLDLFEMQSFRNDGRTP